MGKSESGRSERRCENPQMVNSERESASVKPSSLVAAAFGCPAGAYRDIASAIFKRKRETNEKKKYSDFF